MTQGHRRNYTTLTDVTYSNADIARAINESPAIVLPAIMGKASTPSGIFEQVPALRDRISK